MVHIAVGGGDPAQAGVWLAAASGLVLRGSQAHSDGLRAISHWEMIACARWGRLQGPAVLESEGLWVWDGDWRLQVIVWRWLQEELLCP